MASTCDWLAERLPLSFYERPVLRVARELIGKVLVHDAPQGLAAGRIVEAEAYRGPEDLAAHSAGGRRTKRTEAMFGPPGRVYIFRLYGMHWAFNVVAGPEGHPHAVLVRALDPLPPFEAMCARRDLPAGDKRLANGPGKVCAALGLCARHYGADLTTSAELFIAADPAGEVPSRIGRSGRINVDYAGSYAARPWRFYERGNRCVSVRPRD